MRSRSRLVFIAALLALVAFAGVVTQAVFVHTGDGCQVEQHCTACRIALGGIAVQGPAVSLATSLAPVGTVEPPSCVASSETFQPPCPSRAPPLA